MPRQGRKQTGQPPHLREGRISEHRIAWVETFAGQFVVLAYPPGWNDTEDNVPEIRNEPGPTVRLMIQNKGRAQFYALTALTSEELANLRTVLNLAIDLAEPIVELRDKAAQNAYESGDDTFARIYRQVREIVVREGAFAENGVGVHFRPEGDAVRTRGAGGSEGGLRDDGGVLADGEPSEHLTPDDGS